MQSLTTSFPSFFDSFADSTPFKFLKPELKHRSHLIKQPLTKANITCKCLNNKQISIKGHFKLQGNLLTYFHDEAEDSPRLVLDLLYARLKILDRNLTAPKFKLLLSRKNISFELSFTKQTTFEYWIECLQSICVLYNNFDKYIPLHQIDEHSLLSTVYLAKDKTRPEGFFAVKRFTKEKLTTPDLKNEVLNQIARMRAIEHPNIVKLNQVYETDSFIYLAKEYDPSHTLQSLLSCPDFSFADFEPQTIKILNHLLQALAYISSQGFIHRHVIPNNILISDEGDAKLVDFGLITCSHIPEASEDHPLPPGYIAPEVFRYDKKTFGTAYNPLCDVFSIGCIFFEMLFGVRLFDGEDQEHTLELNKSYSYARVAQKINKERNNPQSRINKQGLDLLLRLLETDPRKRISAEMALEHEYFKAETDRIVQFNSKNEIFLFSITKIRSCCTESDANSPGLQFSQFSSSHKLDGGISRLNTSGFLDPRDLSSCFRGKPAQEGSSKPGENLLPLNLDEKAPIYETPRFLNNGKQKGVPDFRLLEDVKSGFGGGTRRFRVDEEDSGELEEAEEEKVEIKAFLDAHRIEITLKNPGKMFG